MIAEQAVTSSGGVVETATRKHVAFNVRLGAPKRSTKGCWPRNPCWNSASRGPAGGARRALRPQCLQHLKIVGSHRVRV